MRLFFDIFSADGETVRISFMMRNGTGSVVGTFQQTEDGSPLILFSLPSTDEATAKVVRELHNLTEGVHNIRGSVLITKLIAGGGRQVVHDGIRYRNVSTMKESSNTYEATGTGIRVSANDEKAATKRLTAKVTEAMAERPEQAAELAGWFAAQRPVEEVASGKLPEVIPVSVLGSTGEPVTAKEPAKEPAKPRTRKRRPAK